MDYGTTGVANNAMLMASYYVLWSMLKFSLLFFGHNFIFFLHLHSNLDSITSSIVPKNVIISIISYLRCKCDIIKF